MNKISVRQTKLEMSFSDQSSKRPRPHLPPRLAKDEGSNSRLKVKDTTNKYSADQTRGRRICGYVHPIGGVTNNIIEKLGCKPETLLPCGLNFLPCFSCLLTTLVH